MGQDSDVSRESAIEGRIVTSPSGARESVDDLLGKVGLGVLPRPGQAQLGEQESQTADAVIDAVPPLVRFGAALCISHRDRCRQPRPLWLCSHLGEHPADGLLA